MSARRDLPSLVADLRRLGVRPGQDLLVHSSLRTIGPVDGGAATVLAALREAAGPLATIVVPTHTTGNSRSSPAFRAGTTGLDAGGLAGYIGRMPGFDPVATPSSRMGAFAEYVRTRAGAERSSHPQTSFAAIGPQAAACVSGHRLDCHLGESSPIGWLHRRGAAILLLGVGYAACTAFHLAEYQLAEDLPVPRRVYRCFVMVHGVRQEHAFWDLELTDSDFEAIGSAMDGTDFVRRGPVGAADCRLIPMREAVRFAWASASFRRLRTAAGQDPARPERGRVVQQVTDALAGPEAARYFFLSYPRLPPLPPVDGVDIADPPDDAVRAFFRDLTAAVRRRTGRSAPLRAGFLDRGSPADAGWRTTLVDALGAAEVLVPLLSPEYIRRSWPRREWASFDKRLEYAGVAEPQRRVMPVLWAPLSAGEQPPEVQAALSLAHGVALAPYAENGLRALSRLAAYRGYYEEIVAELAARIVGLAEKVPAGVSAAQDPALVDCQPGLEGSGVAFAVVTAAPVPAATRPGRDGSHGAAWSRWRPFGSTEEAPLVEYARLAVEERFAVLMPELEKSAELLQQVPGVVLIDAAYVADSRAGAALETFVGELPSWVLPVVVVSQDGTPYLAQMRAMLEKKYNPRSYKPEAVRRALMGVSTLREFVGVMPFLVTRAEREYLRHGPIRPLFPRLAPARGSQAGQAVYLPMKETPDV